MDYRLVPMNRSHLAAVAAIERDCFSSPWTEEMLAEELQHENAVYLVAEEGEGGVLGYAGLLTVLDEGYVTNVAVAPAFRRKGVADALVSALCRFGKEKLAFLTLEVRASNKPAVSLYEKYGFSPVGRRSNYYEHPVEDAVLMTLTFSE